MKRPYSIVISLLRLHFIFPLVNMFPLMAGRERQQKNNPGNYTADIWGNQLEQQAGGRRRGKSKTVLINGVPHVQGSLFSGEEMRVPFPDAPVNKVPDHVGMTAEPGTLFSRPVTEPQSTQNALFVTSPETTNPTSQLPAAGQHEEDRQHVPLPVAIPANKQTAPEPAPTAIEGEQNPLLAILHEDEIYVDPNEVTIEEAEENGFPLLRRDVVTYRWWLEFPFDTREQPELNQALKDARWKWGGYRQQWNTNAHFPDMPQDMQYANAGPAFYSEENAQRIEARATKARATSTAHLERSDRLAEVIPFGQPMMPDHSYRSDLSYRKKIWRQMDLFCEFYKKAEWLDNRAEGSRRLQRRKSSIATMQNRIDTLNATLRSVRRDYEEAKSKDATYLDYYRKRLTILASEIIPLQSAIAERGGLPIEKAEAQRPLQQGDLIQIRGRAMYVVKVNPKTIKVADPRVHDAKGEMWELTYKKSDFQRVLATREEVEAMRAKEADMQDGKTSTLPYPLDDSENKK